MQKFFIALFIIPLVIQAQNISVISFKSVPGDMAARVTASVTDQNGDKCALIKIQTTQTGFVFEGDMMGIEKTEQKTAEIWVYVPHGAKRLSIAHQQLGRLNNYLYPEPIKEATVYVMQLTTAKVTTIVEPTEIPMQWITINSIPNGADIFLNEEFVGNTPFQKKMEVGKYNYRIEKLMYLSSAGVFNLNASKKEELEFNLTPNYGDIEINVINEEGASVQILGTTQSGLTPFLSDDLPVGKYKASIKKVMFIPQIFDFEIIAGKTNYLDVDLEPNFATINIETNPKADIYIDDKLVGNGSFTGRLMDGLHTVTAKLDKHTEHIEQIELNIGENKNISLYPKPITGSVDIVTTPMGAKVFLNGENKGTSPLTLNDLLIGEYEITIGKKGYVTANVVLTIMSDSNSGLNRTLIPGKKVFINTVPEGVELYVGKKRIGKTPVNTTLPFGKHALKLINGSKVVNEEITINQTDEAIWNFDVRDEDGIIIKGMLVDTRDNEQYKTVIVGDQVWMAENLRYASGHYTDDNNIWSTMGDEGEAYCFYRNKEEYGTLYTFIAAKNACPSGWHLPSKQEFDTLVNNYGGILNSKEKFKKGGRKGFNARYGGQRDWRNGKYYSRGISAAFWSSSIISSNKAYTLSIPFDHCAVQFRRERYSNGFSVRCIKD